MSREPFVTKVQLQRSLGPYQALCLACGEWVRTVSSTDTRPRYGLHKRGKSGREDCEMSLVIIGRERAEES